MKSKNVILGIGLSVIFFMSCSKKESPTPLNNTTPATLSVSDYFPMTIGSYWVYKQTEYDSSGNIMPQTWKNDSIIIKNDTVINSKTYHALTEYNFIGETASFQNYLRDSADCIVDNQGKIVFSINRSGLIFKDILSADTLAYINYYFNGTPANITVPLSTYSCVDYRGEVFRKIDNFSKVYYTHKYFYQNIGQVEKIEMFIGGLNRFYFDLLAYHIQ